MKKEDINEKCVNLQQPRKNVTSDVICAKESDTLNDKL